VPRVRSENAEIPLQSYREFAAGSGEMDEVLMRRIVYGISCRNYEQAAAAIPVPSACRVRPCHGHL